MVDVHGIHYAHPRVSRFAIIDVYVLPKYRDAFIKKSKPVGGAAWWREWPTGFEDIDDDHRLIPSFAGDGGHVHQDWHDAE